MAIHTIGYGIAKWSEFAQRLDDAKITGIIDVRREGCKSRNGREFYQSSRFATAGIRFHLRDEGIEYAAEPALSKGKKEGLTAYHSRLYHALTCSAHAKEASAYGRVRDNFLVGTGKIALLCACRDHYRCHRKILAIFLYEELELPIIHL